MHTQIPFDPSDPVIAVGSVLLTEVLKRLAPKLLDRLSPVIPALVCLLAIALRALLDAVAEGGVSWSSLWRGLAAAGVAVLSYSQVRSAGKAMDGPKG